MSSFAIIAAALAAAAAAAFIAVLAILFAMIFENVLEPRFRRRPIINEYLGFFNILGNISVNMISGNTVNISIVVILRAISFLACSDNSSALLLSSQHPFFSS